MTTINLHDLDEYWITCYVNGGMCSLCGNSGVIDTRGVYTAADIEVGRLNYCLCPNGRKLREYEIPPESVRRARVDTHPRDYSLIPPAIKEALDAWARDGHPHGDFVRACLQNDLLEAAARADANSGRALVAIVIYMANELPAPCWGSREKYLAWEAQMTYEREQRQKAGAT